MTSRHHHAAVADALHGRLARRQAFMEKLFDALAPVVGPRVSFEAAGGKGVTLLVVEVPFHEDDR